MFAGFIALGSLAVPAWTDWQAQAATEKRVAIIIGNSAYKNVSKLPILRATQRLWRRC